MGTEKDELIEQFEDGDLDTGAFIGKMDDMLRRDLANEIDTREYHDRYLRDNPGYADAYNSGALNESLRNGLTAEEAYTRYKEKEGKEMRAAGRIGRVDRGMKLINQIRKQSGREPLY